MLRLLAIFVPCIRTKPVLQTGRENDCEGIVTD